MEKGRKCSKKKKITQNMNSEIEHAMQAIAIAIPQFPLGHLWYTTAPQPQTVARKYNTFMCKYGLSS